MRFDTLIGVIIREPPMWHHRARMFFHRCHGLLLSCPLHHHNWPSSVPSSSSMIVRRKSIARRHNVVKAADRIGKRDVRLGPLLGQEVAHLYRSSGEAPARMAQLAESAHRTIQNAPTTTAGAVSDQFVTARAGFCFHKSSRLSPNASLNTPFNDDENNFTINHGSHQESFGHFVEFWLANVCGPASRNSRTD